MATTNTTLSGAIDQNATMVTLTAFSNPSAGGIGPKTWVKVDGETMLVTSTLLAPTLQVVRGYDGTLATSHNTLAPIAYGLAPDFVTTNLLPNVTSYSVSGAIAVPQLAANREVFIVLNKAGVAAMTLAAPAADQNGLILTITSNTAQAHTVTATGLFQDGSTTTDVATFAAHPGAGFTVQAVNGKWNVTSNANASITFS